MTEKFLKEAEVAEMFNVSKRTLQEWRRSGKGPRHFKLGGMIRYRPKDIDKYLAKAAGAGE